VEYLSPLEIKVKKLVEEFFANKISGEEFKQELTREQHGLRQKKQRILPKAKGRTYS